MTVSGKASYSVSYSYDANNRLLTERKTRGLLTDLTTYAYDANGSLLSKTFNGGDGSLTGAAYTYNLFNQLSTAAENGLTAAYAYNAQGIRTCKATATSQTHFLLDGGNVVGEHIGSKTVTYLRGANLISRSDGSKKTYYLFNAHGDVTELVSDSSTVTHKYDYDAFGVEKKPDPLDGNPFRYCGEYYDVETGTYYLRARYYNAEIGRFITEDPIRNGANWYAYCSSNPIIYVDPSGLKDIAVRSTIEDLGGVVRWNDATRTATIYLDGKSITVRPGDGYGSYIDKNGKLHTDDAWLFFALGSTFDLGKGWHGRIERGTSGKDYRRHIHVYKADKMWSQNDDGSPHDDGKNSPGAPPKKVLKNLKDQKGWDWAAKEKEWLNKIVVSNVDFNSTEILYPNGRKVTIYQGSNMLTLTYFPDAAALKKYYFGATYVDLSVPSFSIIPNFTFSPMLPNIPLPSLFPMPIPAF